MKSLKRKSTVTLLFPLLLILLSSQCSKPQRQTQQPVPTTTPSGYTTDVSDLTNLPADAGGTQTPVYISSSVPYGFYIYLPTSYQSNQLKYPVLIYLTGSGSVGNGTASDLNKVLSSGPPALVTQKKWHPPYPTIIVSPQTTTTYDPDVLHSLIQYIISHYRINTHRMYLTGASSGGSSTYKYAVKYADIAAAIPIASGYSPGGDNAPPGTTLDTKNLINLPLWNFYGAGDVNLHKGVDIVNTLNQLHPQTKAKITVFPNVGHNSWDMTYNGSGMGKNDKNYDAFDVSIYDWMFNYIR